MNDKPFVSVIIPCRNEEKYISKCLDSIIANDYPKDRIEIFVIDGMSTDGTNSVVENYVKKYNFIKLLKNPKKTASSAMNIGIKNSRGDIIIRMDAHNIYKEDYISKCVNYLDQLKADNVGGIWITLPGENSSIAKAISLVLSHPFGIGNSYFRRGVKEIREVDTVPFGCYKREVFERIGFFNENLIRNQDIEFNLRLKRAGGKIFLCPDIVSYYYARSNLRSLFKQNFMNGFWVVYSLKYANLPFSYRHLVPAVFLLSLLLSLLLIPIYKNAIYFLVGIWGIYAVLDIISSFSLSLKHGLKYFPYLIITFPTLHFSYGFGSLWGGIRLILSRLKGEKDA